MPRSPNYNGVAGSEGVKKKREEGGWCKANWISPDLFSHEQNCSVRSMHGGGYFMRRIRGLRKPARYEVGLFLMTFDG